MSQLIEVSNSDYGYSIEVTLYKNDDTVTAENLSTASNVSLDITRCDETPIVNDAAVTVTDAANGVVTFTPLSTWFTDTSLGGRSYYIAIFKINYTSGAKHSFPIPVYVHQS
jgi:hypothetical protein